MDSCWGTSTGKEPHVAYSKCKQILDNRLLYYALIAQHGIILTNRKRGESYRFLVDVEQLQGLITWTLSSK